MKNIVYILRYLSASLVIVHTSHSANSHPSIYECSKNTMSPVIIVSAEESLPFIPEMYPEHLQVRIAVASIVGAFEATPHAPFVLNDTASETRGTIAYLPGTTSMPLPYVQTMNDKNTSRHFLGHLAGLLTVMRMYKKTIEKLPLITEAFHPAPYNTWYTTLAQISSTQSTALMSKIKAVQQKIEAIPEFPHKDAQISKLYTVGLDYPVVCACLKRHTSGSNTLLHEFERNGWTIIQHQ